jgi:hypothetical protein
VCCTECLDCRGHFVMVLGPEGFGVHHLLFTLLLHELFSYHTCHSQQMISLPFADLISIGVVL